MREGDTLACNLSGERVRGLWAQIDQKNRDILGGTPTWDLDVPVHPIVANHAGWPSLTQT